jgi:cytochrome P450
MIQKGRPMNIFSDDVRRNPYPLYDQLRTTSPVLRVPPPFSGWMIFDYDSVKRALNDHETSAPACPRRATGSSSSTRPPTLNSAL